MRAFIAAVSVCVAVSATAQQQIPLPAFNRTFSSSSLTRGIYFQTPVAFTMIGLRVPDEANHGLQNVAVYRMAGKPPAYPTTVNGGLLFYRGGVASSLVIPTALTFNKDEWVGVFGACGDNTIMHNSYSPVGPFASSVLGQPTSLYRLNTQTNIVSTQGTGGYSNYDIGEMGRVEIYITGTLIQGSGTGAPGTAMNFGLSAPRSPGLPFQIASSLGTGPIPIGTRSLGLSLDNLFAASVSATLPTVFVNYVGLIGASGGASAALNIPPLPILKGLTIHTAFVTFDAGSPAGIKEISNTFTFMIT